MNQQKLDQHLDAVLRAAGSALRHYSLPKSLDDMRAAMKAAIDDATLDLQARVAELEAERAERAAQKPVAQIDDDECFQGPCRHATAFVPMPRGTPLYAAPPVTAPVRLTDKQIAESHANEIMNCLQDPCDKSESVMPMPHDVNRFVRAIETAVLRANGFNIDHPEHALELVGLRGCTGGAERGEDQAAEAGG